MYIKFFSAIVASVVIAGCGGGSGGGASTEAADKYSGNWVSNCVPVGTNQTQSELEYRQVLKQSANKFAVNITYAAFNNTNCSGTPFQVTKLSVAEVTIVGTQSATFVPPQSANAVTADQWNVSVKTKFGQELSPPVVLKDIAAIVDGKWFDGGGELVNFPTALETFVTYTKFTGSIPTGSATSCICSGGGAITPAPAPAPAPAPGPTPTPNDVAGKYVGAWASNCYQVGTNLAQLDYFTISQKSANELMTFYKVAGYTNATCQGEPTQVTLPSIADVTIVGTQVNGSVTADQWDVSVHTRYGLRLPTPELYKDIAAIVGGRIVLGGAAGSNGFPTALENSYFLTPYTGPVPNGTATMPISTAPSNPPVTPTLPAGSADKYVGTWVTCADMPMETEPGSGVFTFTSVKKTLVHAKVGPSEIAWSLTRQDFFAAGCPAADSGPTLTETGRDLLTGTKSVNNVAVDLVQRITFPDPAVSPNVRFSTDLAAIVSGRLYRGDISQLGQDGYPVELDAVEFFTKQ